MPHRFLERAEAELCEQFTHFLGNEHHEVHHMFGFAGEACPELRILRGDTLWAGVLLACAHHHTAFHHKSGGGEAELLRSQQRRDHHVTAGLQFAVALDDDARAKTIENQRLLGFRQTDLPWRAGMADGVERGRSGTAVIAGNEHHVGMALSHTGRNGAHTEFGHEFDMHASLRIGHLRIVDELLEILDGVDVMMRRRRDELHARRCVAHLGDPRRHFGPGRWPPSPGLAPLRQFDLQIGGMHQIIARHTETGGGDLLDFAAQLRIVEPFR